MINLNMNQLPVFLQSYGDLMDHLTSQLDGLSNKAKGDTFAEFTSKIIPLTDVGVKYQFDDIKTRQASYDDGVDLESLNLSETKMLNAQCKLTLKDVDEFDLIISKFQNFYNKLHNIQENPAPTPLFEEYYELTEKAKADTVFMIVTLSNLARIVPLYEKSSRPSKKFYEKLKNNGMIYLLDGPKILPIAQAAYRKLHVLPSNVELHLETPPIHKDNVYIAIISASELKECYDKFGDALFFENIRSFLGYNSGKKKSDTNREYVNEAILATAEQDPSKMLAKNNGITFRARSVFTVDEKILKLDEASIVNGCQTTMCLVRAPQPGAFVLVKIVETSNSWDIAKAANFQNRVEQIELELAQYIRPQYLKKLESKAEIHIIQSANESVFDIFSSIYQNQIAYDEIYYLFIGFFSKKISNVISTNYTELDDELLKALLTQEGLSESTFAILFELYKAAQKARILVEKKYKSEAYKPIFQRFWRDNKPNYRSIFTILAACGCIKTNIYSKQSNLNTLLQNLRYILDSDTERYIRYYHYAFEAIAAYLLSSRKDEKEILRTMYDELRTANFDNLYKNILLIADGRETNEEH